ncbi:metallophosphoesterase [Bacillus sp. FJAT-18017]|uniref:metallophosphoesterase n=1 Tax=Bacillus sp. FJAT-18017 TaxID=1705566 RepID=UPI0006ADAAB1|nr:metallophosphoesterase [Bacillus sp. FJAT-18017]
MNRKFAISDIHGQFEPLKALLAEAKFNPEQDTLVVVGDMIDRGPQSAEVVRFLKGMQDQHPENIFVTLGNHEIMMRRYAFEGNSHMWLYHGGTEVIKEFNTEFVTVTERNEHFVWLANLPLYVMDEEHFFTHAGIDPFEPLANQKEDVTFMQLRQLYLQPANAMTKRIGNRKIVHGHTPYPFVYQTERFVSCDTGASIFKEGKLSLADLTNNVYFSCETETLHITKQGIRLITELERLKG